MQHNMIHPMDNSLSGRIGVWLRNVGYYNGKSVDVKCTYYWKPLTLNGMNIYPFIDATIYKKRLAFQFRTSAYEVKYELYSNGKPINLNMSLTFGDIDACQFFGFKINSGKIHSMSCVQRDPSTGKTPTSYYLKQNGYDYFFAPNVQSGDTLESSIRLEIENANSFNIIYGCEIDLWSYPIDRFIPYGSDWCLNNVIKFENSYRSFFNNNGSGGIRSVGEGWGYFDSTAYGPFSMPTPVKSISDSDETDVTENTINKDETFTYDIYSYVPDEIPNYYWSSYSISDTLPSCVEYISAKVFNGAGTDISSKFTINKSEQTITASTTQTTNASFYGDTYHLQLKVKFKSDEINNYKKSDVLCQFTNQAIAKANRKGTIISKKSNIVTTNYPIVNSTILKIWDDTNNNDGFRPGLIQMKLYQDDTILKTINLTSDMNWNYTEQNLPKQNGSHIYEYKWEENETYTNNDKYEMSNIVQSGLNTSITNTHTLETISSTITKTWNDTNNHDGFRPSSVKMQLYKNGEVIKTITLNESNNWTYTENDLLKYSSIGQLNTYYWREIEDFTNNDKYEIGNISQDGYNTTITNTHTLETINSTITKTWDDTDNHDGFRPSSVKMQLYKNGEVIKTITLNESNNWKYTEINLLKYSPIGQLNTYYWREIEDYSNHDKYKLSNTSQDGYNTTITNHHTLETIESKVTKIWDDTDNHDGFRPNEIQVQLYKNEKVIKTITLSKSNNWTYIEKDLLKYSPIGQLNTYYWREVEDFTNHNKYEISNITQDGYNTTITNQHTLERINTKITKIWDDTNNHDGFRPNEIEMSLYKDGRFVKTIILNENNKWQYTESDLLKYKPQGQLVNYEWKEEETYSNHNKYKISNTQIDGYNTTITNYHKLEEIESKITKIWNDTNNNDGFRPDSIEMILYKNDKEYKRVTIDKNTNWEHIEKNLLKYSPIGQLNTYYWRENPIFENSNKYEILKTEQEGYNTTITNWHELEKVSSTITKIWSDENNNDGYRPKTIYAKLYQDEKVFKDRVILNEGNQYKHTQYNLPKYHNQGVEYKYSWDEYTTFENADKYKATKSQNGNNTTIINKHELEKVEVHVKKIWNDNNNHDKVRPNVIQVNLLGNGKIIKQVDLSIVNNWETTIRNLNKYEPCGKEIYYTFEEPVLYYDYESQVETKDYNTIIVNTRDLTKTSRTVKKEWRDNNNQDQMRPASVQVELLANGEVIQSNISLNNENQWQVKINNLNYKDENGEIIQYEFKEKSIPEGYEVSYDTDGKQTIITNTYTSSKTKAMVQKIWDDNNNQDGIRPDSVTMRLYANGEGTKYKVTLNEHNEWRDSIANLDKYKNGDIIRYEFKEEIETEGYTSTSEQNGNLTLITNHHKPELTEAKVKKIWEDDNNADGVRPNEVQVVLYANGKPIVDTNGDEFILTLSEINNWESEITNLPKYKNGEEQHYYYELKNKIPEYTSSKEINEPLTTITSIHTREKIDLRVIKEWEDKDDVDKLRPNEVQVKLFANEEEIENLTLSKENKWTQTVTNLNKNEKGQPIDYRFEEDGLPLGYSNQIEVEGNETRITNLHKPNTTSVTIKKVWEDGNNADGLRPSEIKVNLLANNEKVNEYILDEANNWQLSINDLPLNEKGKPIEYTFEEITYIKGYTSEIETKGALTTITNTHKPQETELKVTKEWKDNNNSDLIRPDEVSVELLANDEVIEKICLSNENNWTQIISNLPKNKEGKEIVYKFKEKTKVENYTTTYKQIAEETIITNSYTPEVVNLEVEKIWIDDNNRDEVRPHHVIVILMDENEPILDENGNQIKLTLNESNNWSGVIENQPKYKDGKEIQYHFVLENAIDKYETSYEQSSYKTIITSVHESEKVQPEVQVIWDDLANKYQKRPNEVVVKLYIDGEPTDIEVTLNEGNNWYKQLEAMPKYKEGKEIEYKFIEIVPELYKESYEYEGTKTIITNYLREEPEESPIETTTNIETSTQAETIQLKEEKVPKEKVVLKETTTPKQVVKEDGKVDKVRTSDNSNIYILIILLVSLALYLGLKINKKYK